MVVAQEVKESVKREHANFRRFAVASLARLPLGDASSNHDVSEE